MTVETLVLGVILLAAGAGFAGYFHGFRRGWVMKTLDIKPWWYHHDHQNDVLAPGQEPPSAALVPKPLFVAKGRPGSGGEAVD